MYWKTKINTKMLSWPSHPIYIKFLQCLLSVCLCVCNVFFTMVTNPYILAKNKDNDTKLSGYDPWGLPRPSMLSRMTLSSKSPIRNPQRPQSTPIHILAKSWWISKKFNPSRTTWEPCARTSHPSRTTWEPCARTSHPSRTIWELCARTSWWLLSWVPWECGLCDAKGSGL